MLHLEMESKHSSMENKCYIQSEYTSGKSDAPSESYGEQDACVQLKTSIELKVKRNHLKTEGKKSDFPLLQPLTSSPASMKTTLDVEYLLPVNSLYEEESSMSLNVSFQSQEGDSKADINDLSHIQSSDSVAEHSALSVSYSSSMGALDTTFLDAKSAYSAHVTEQSSSVTKCDLSSDRPDAATLSASAVWEFDEASYASLTSSSESKNIASFCSSSRERSLCTSALIKSLISRSPISLDEIPLPPSPKRVVHVDSFSNTTGNSVPTFYDTMTSTPLSSSPNESSSSTQENKRSRRRTTVANREKILKPVCGKAMSSKAIQWSRCSATPTNFRSCPKKKLSLSPSFASKNPYPVKQSLEQKASYLAKKFKLVQSKNLESSSSFAEVSGISRVKHFSRGENCATQSRQTAELDFRENVPSSMMLCPAKSPHEFQLPEMGTCALDLEAGSSRGPDTSCGGNFDDRAGIGLQFRMKQVLQRRKSYGVKSNNSSSELDSSSDRPLDWFNETKSYTHGPFYASAVLSEIFSVGFIDTHCHLDFLFNKTHHQGTLSEYISKMESKDNDLFKFPASYEGCVAVFCQPDTFHKTEWYERLLSEDHVWAAFGCHPHFCRSFGALELYHLKKALEHPKVIALGEIGLDYSHKNNVDVSIQHVVLKIQLSLAVEKKLPLVIHSRNAHIDTLQIIRQHVPANTRMHRHCFTETWKEAVEWLEAFPNCFIGFTNLVSQRGSRGKRLTDVVRRIPLNRLLLETDAPYFTPDCVRAEGGYHAHPGHALHVAVEVARVKGLSVEEVLVATRRNTATVYGI